MSGREKLPEPTRLWYSDPQDPSSAVISLAMPCRVPSMWWLLLCLSFLTEVGGWRPLPSTTA